MNRSFTAFIIMSLFTESTFAISNATNNTSMDAEIILENRDQALFVDWIKLERDYSWRVTSESLRDDFAKMKRLIMLKIGLKLPNP